MLHFPTVPRREIALSACNELLWSACYVGVSLAFINLWIFWSFYFCKVMLGIKMLCTPVLVTFACLSIYQFLSN